MYYQEKRAIVSLISNIVIFAVYYMMVQQEFIERAPEGQDFLKFWGAVILILMPVLIVSRIVVMIAFAIVNKILTNEDYPKVEDEMDKIIELKSVRTFSQVFMSLFMACMLFLVLGYSAEFMFKMLLTSSIVAGISMDMTHIYFYRKGRV